MVQAFSRCLPSSSESIAANLQAGGPDLAVSTLLQQAAYFLLSEHADVIPAAEDSLETFFASAAPVLLNVGGQQRVLAVGPGSIPEPWKKGLEAIYGNCVSTCSEPNQLTLYCNVDEIKYEDVLNQFTQHNPRLTEVAKRVHTRIDVDW